MNKDLNIKDFGRHETVARVEKYGYKYFFPENAPNKPAKAGTKDEMAIVIFVF